MNSTKKSSSLPAAKSGQIQPENGGCILIVEDYKPQARQFARTLSKMGYTCLLAYDALQALDLIKTETIDLHIVDLRLPAPSPSGLEYITQLHTIRKDSAVIIITALEDDATIQQALKLDLYGYMIKPISDKQLSVCVNNAMLRIALERALKKQLDNTQALVVERTKELSIFKAFADQSGQGLIMGTLDNRIRYVNPAFKKMVGEPASTQITGKSIVNHYPAKLKTRIEQKILPEVLQAGNWSGELSCKKNDGCTFPTWENHFLIKDQSGAPLYFGDIISDISRLKQSQAETETQLMLLRTIIDTIPSPVYYQNREGKIVSVNKSYLEFKGFEQIDVVGKSVFDIMAPELAQVHDKVNRQLLKKLGFKTYETIAVRADGTQRNVIVYKASFPEADGQIGGLVSVMIDITESKRMTEALQASRASFKAIVQRSIEAILIVSHDGRILFANQGAELLFGRSADKLVGSEFGHPMSSETPVEIEILLPQGDLGVGEMRTEPTRWEDQSVLLVSIRDITDRVAAEEKLRQTIGQLKKANRTILEQQTSALEEERLKVLLQLAGATAHEFSQPLMILMGYIDMVAEDIGDSERVNSHLDEMREAGRRLSDVVQRIKTIRPEIPAGISGDGSVQEVDREVRILSIDDSVTDYQVLESIFSATDNFFIYRSGSLQSALERISHDVFDLILLDYALPDGTGLDFLNELARRNIQIPVIVITGQGDEVIASQIIQAGAYEYIPKLKISPNSLHRAIANTLEKAKLRQEVALAQQKISRMAVRDELTGLYNRRYFIEALERECARAIRSRVPLSLCILDLDHFKQVNDTYGHLQGDEVLKKFAGLLKKSSRDSDLVCRYGGEEFAIICSNASSSQVMNLYQRLKAELEKCVFECDGRQFHVTASAGVAQFDKKDINQREKLIAAADQYLYAAKQAGRNCASCSWVPIEE
jgi:two-component system, cell cycle response regulator